MSLLASEQDRLLLFLAAELARKRRARGLRLTEAEARALIADETCEAARDGASYAEAAAAGHAALRPGDVLPDVPALLTRVEVEPLFGDGHRLVVLHHPLLGRREPDEAHPSDLNRHAAGSEPEPTWGDGPELGITNHAEVAIGLTSHLHLFEVNRALELDRRAAWGMHLDVLPGEKVHLAPGATAKVRMHPFGGARVLRGHSELVDGPLDAPGALEAALERAHALGYRGA